MPFVMENLQILDILKVRKAVKDCIDRPATLCEVMMERYQPSDKAATTLVLSEIMDKLCRHKDCLRGSSLPVDLENLVEDVLTGIQESITDQDNKVDKYTTPAIFCIFKKRSLRTEETIDKTLYKDLERKTKVLRGLIISHQNLIAAIQKAQQDCWIGKSKVNKYKLMLDTAKASREYLKDKVSKRALRIRDNAIRDLQKTLKIKEEKYDCVTMTYCKLKCQVETTRREMVQLRDNIHNSIKSELLDRMEGAMISLTHLSKTFLTEKRQKLLSEKLEAISLRTIANAILSEGNKTYSYPDPSEYTRVNGFDKQIPKATFYQCTKNLKPFYGTYHEKSVPLTE